MRGSGREADDIRFQHYNGEETVQRAFLYRAQAHCTNLSQRGCSMSALNMQTAVGRWAGLGPYYAMFPVDFAFRVVSDFTRPGDAVLDPFAGRGSSIYAAAACGRSAVGIEIHPVGWLYSRVKLAPATRERVLRRLFQLGETALSAKAEQPNGTGEFFRRCYSPAVLRFLTVSRQELRWRESPVDSTLMALILVYLHGKRTDSLSNQMRQGKAMSPDYSVRWWKERNLRPPRVDPVEFLRQRIEWRYAKGVPHLSPAQAVLGDARTQLRRLSHKVARGRLPKFGLLFTSPPYFGVTNYHVDQWLRLWMLGGQPRPASGDGFARGRFRAKEQYTEFLADVFRECANLLNKNATIYVRTDARPFTYRATMSAVRAAFPRKSVSTRRRPYRRQTQTVLFGDTTPKPGEVDIIFR